MPVNCDAYIRLAQVFDSAGLHATADLIDSRMQRIAFDISELKQPDDELASRYKGLIGQAYKKHFTVSPGNANFSSLRGSASYWVYPDGSVIDLENAYHDEALERIEHKTKSPFTNKKLAKDPDYADLKEQYRNSYHMISSMFGAIRVYVEYLKYLVVTSYTVPTPEQINTIDNLTQHWKVSGLRVEQFGHVLGDAARFSSLPEWEIAIEKYQRAVANAGDAEPAQQSEFQNTIKNVDESSFGAGGPYWKAIERKRLEEEYPGEANAPLRKMYERSASVYDDADEDAKQDIEHGKQTLWNEWTRNYPVVPSDAPVEISDSPTYSYWILADGSRMELGEIWHGSAFHDIYNKQGLQHHPGVKQMWEDSYDVYKLMGENYGVVRVFATSYSLSVSAYQIPTMAQIQAVSDILQATKQDDVSINQKFDGGVERYFYSIPAWIAGTESKRPKTNRTEHIDEQNAGLPLWKVQDRRRLLEEYPGESNAPLRKMYERSASVNNDEQYKKLIEEGHKNRFGVLEPGEKVPKFRKMHSFWIYPDGRMMDLDKKWHDEAFHDVMYDSGLVNHEDFREYYRSTDGPHEIMSNYFGMIRLFVTDAYALHVTSYSKPTQAQIDQIQNVASQIGSSSIRIEQIGHVNTNRGRLVTNSMAKWIEEINKFTPATAESAYNTMHNKIDEVNQVPEQPYWKSMEQKSLEENYPDNEQLRKMYERSASYGIKV